MGFWSKLLGIGAAVAAPFTGGTSLAFLPGLLGAGSAISGALEGRGKGGSGGSSLPGGTIGGMIPGGNMFPEQQARIKQMQDYGTEDVASSRKALDPALGYYGKLLSGDRGAAMEAVAPEVGTILGQYDTARKAVSQNAPMGGGRTRALASLPFQKLGAVQNLLFGARRDAAEKSASLGLNLGQQATSRLGAGLNAYDSMLGRQLSAAGVSDELGMRRAEIEYKRQKDLGASIGGFINSILLGLPGLGKGGDGGSKAPIDPGMSPGSPTIPFPREKYALGDLGGRF